MNVNGRPAMRLGDKYSNRRTLAEGSSGVFINGKPAGRIGDRNTGGGVALTGSPDVFIGEQWAGKIAGAASGGAPASPSGGTACQVEQARRASPTVRG